MFSAYQLLLTDNHVRTRETLTLGPSAGNRNLDLLVLNQGHGGIGLFDGWDCNALATELVAPMVASGISANIVVLDFCLSASLLPTLAPLCAPGGILVSSLYSVSDIVVTSDFWDAIKHNLDIGNVGGLKAQVMERLSVVSAGITGFSHLDQVRGWSEARTQQQILAFPNDRDPISIIRYLPDMASALSDGTVTLPQLFQRLQAVKAKPCLGFAEQAILANLPGSAAGFTDAMRTIIENQFAARLTDILTLDRYGIKTATAGRPTFGGDQSLWGQISQSRIQILALASGLPRCPTPYAVWNQSRGSLSLDSALAQVPISNSTRSLITIIEPDSPDDVTQILGQLTGTQVVPTLERVNNFLQ